MQKKHRLSDQILHIALLDTRTPVTTVKWRFAKRYRKLATGWPKKATANLSL